MKTVIYLLFIVVACFAIYLIAGVASAAECEVYRFRGKEICIQRPTRTSRVRNDDFTKEMARRQVIVVPVVQRSRHTRTNILIKDQKISVRERRANAMRATKECNHNVISIQGYDPCK